MLSAQQISQRLERGSTDSAIANQAARNRCSTLKFNPNDSHLLLVQPCLGPQAMEPFFSVLLSWLFLNQPSSPAVLLSLLPIVGGVAMASVSEARRSWLSYQAVNVRSLSCCPAPPCEHE